MKTELKVHIFNSKPRPDSMKKKIKEFGGRLNLKLLLNTYLNIQDKMSNFGKQKNAPIEIQ